ncbi:uncharacterized protein EI90DRAFT_3078881 [Cantharellus anzutake]|uniref:uncharacterized protein n=1 Tax=Cantharellus anzutake TaxID=1750568 RepID=UPI0019068DC0|nr:uncharacterized protein EI90DRAFT_3078881 [Cantharellus anzutake]KAF8321848.1 hypothetical protein EI90DRAFT_3078881 [Cantharellus anzutake]
MIQQEHDDGPGPPARQLKQPVCPCCAHFTAVARMLLLASQTNLPAHRWGRERFRTFT